MTTRRFALVALILAVSAVQAKEKKPVIDVAKAVEVRLNAGTKFRGTILSDKLEIDTPYGKLQVPIVEIRRVEMGVRPTAEIAATIDKAIKNLGSQEFQEREAALNQLINMGELAYKTLQKECKNPDAEVAKLARVGVERIIEKHSEEKLSKVKEDDVVATDRFTIVGRVQSPTLKFKTDEGEKEVKPGDLRGVRWVGRSADVEHKVEAEKHAKTNQWFDTKIDVQDGDEVEIRADGQINVIDDGTGQWACGPTGLERYKAKLARNPNLVLPGLLLGKIGKDGKTFEVGEKYKLTGKEEGRLYLIIGSPQSLLGQEGRSTGSFKVKVTGGREGD